MEIVIFSGAGMSAESGISTFRDKGGLWENYPIVDVATPQAWKNNPEKVQQFYNLRRKNIIEAQSNEAHLLLKSFETIGKVQIITQNIDDLHERAGSSNVVHLHGNIRYSKSSGPNQEKRYYPIEGWELKSTDLCDDGYPLRPHVVWFGEDVPMYEKALEIINLADIFIVIGSSLQVYPAAGLIQFAKNARLKIIIDPAASDINFPSDFNIIQKSATEGLKECFDLLKQMNKKKTE